MISLLRCLLSEQVEHSPPSLQLCRSSCTKCGWDFQLWLLPVILDLAIPFSYNSASLTSKLLPPSVPPEWTPPHWLEDAVLRMRRNSLLNTFCPWLLPSDQRVSSILYKPPSVVTVPTACWPPLDSNWGSKWKAVLPVKYFEYFACYWMLLDKN